MVSVRRAVLAAFVMLASVSSANAYVRTTLKSGRAVQWPTTCVSVQLYTGEPPVGLTADEFLMAARAAAATWNQPATCGTDFDLKVLPVPASSAPVGRDGANRVTFRRARWCKEPYREGDDCYDKSALAITSVMADKYTGEILDADIEINAFDFKWADLVQKADAGNAHDIQNTLTHEFGHLIGLDHTCYGGATDVPRGIDHLGSPIPFCNEASREVRETTMYVSVVRGDLTRRDLTADDEQAVCGVYPDLGGGSCRSTGVAGDEGGCSISPGRRARPVGATGAGLVGLLLVLPFMGAVRRRWHRRG